VKTHNTRLSTEAVLQSKTIIDKAVNGENPTTDDIDKLLIDTSNGELDKEFLNSLPVNEKIRLQKCMMDFLEISQEADTKTL